ncbi:MAG: SpaH/EbpB family LPXTG-anchored major pilin [Eubacteriales bacterium]|nr:SpaH/EbpB family LPXTG-anchored major pilin [Eubacteriales bacterium]
MNRFKKIGAFMLATMMTTSMMALPAMAASNIGDNDIIDTTKVGSLTIHKYDDSATSELNSATGEQDKSIEEAMAEHAVEGVEFTYVKVGDVTTVTEPKDGVDYIQIVYDLPDTLATALGLTSDDGMAVTGHTGTFYNSDDIMSSLASSLKEKEIDTKNTLFDYVGSAATKGTIMTGSDGSGTATGLALGLYLVVETKVPQNINSTTNPFFVALPMTEQTGNDWIYDIHVYPKNQHDVPTIDKDVKSDHSTDFADSATTSIGTTYDYRVITMLPNITDKSTYLTTWQVTDTLTGGIDYVDLTNKESTTLKAFDSLADAEAGTTPSTTLTLAADDYSITPAADNKSVVIALTASGLAKVNAPANSHKYLVYSYKAVLNDKAVLGDAGNDNNAELEWGRTNTEYTQTIDDNARVYAYALDLTKLLSDTPSNSAELLPTVEFTLYDETMKQAVNADVQATAGVYRVNEKHDDKFVFSPDENGKLKIEGLAAGTYTLTEVKSATGYALLKEPVKIVITASEATATAATAGHNDKNKADSPASTDATIATTKNASATVDSNDVTMTKSGESTNAYVPMEIKNTKTWIPNLPVTGGEGTLFVVILGAAVLGLGYVLISRKKAI